MLDKHTYGKSKVATDLVDMLNTRYHPSVSRKVSRSIQSQFKVINSLHSPLAQLQCWSQVEKVLSMYLQYRKLTKPPHAHIDDSLKDRINNIVETRVKCLIDLARSHRNGTVKNDTVYILTETAP